MAIETGQHLEGKEVIDRFGTRVGKVDRVMRRPGQEAEWARVKLGRFGVKATWLPIDQAELTGDSLRVPFGREQIENAHDIASDEDVSLDQQSRLHEHFDSGRDDAGLTDGDGDSRSRAENLRDTESGPDNRGATPPVAVPTGRDANSDTQVARNEMPDVATVRADQREEFGGINWGSAFFGWLVATGIAVILMAIIAAAGASLGLTESDVNESLSIGGAVAFLVTLAIAYYAGGYVAGRMSRFDGARQGAATWAWGIILTLLAAAAGWVVGSEYNILQQLNLPRIPVDEGTLATGAAITLGATALLTLLAAIVGGKVGERYHERVDESTFPDRTGR